MKTNVLLELNRGGVVSQHRAHNTITQEGLNRIADALVSSSSALNNTLQIYADTTSLGALDANYPTTAVADTTNYSVTPVEWRTTERLTTSINPTNFHLSAVGPPIVNLMTVARADLSPALPAGPIESGDQIRLTWSLSVTDEIAALEHRDVGDASRGYTGFAALLNVIAGNATASSSATIELYRTDDSRGRDDIDVLRFAIRWGSDISVAMSRDSSHGTANEARLVTAAWTLPGFPTSVPQGFDHVWGFLVLNGARVTKFLDRRANWGSSSTARPGVTLDLLLRNLS